MKQEPVVILRHILRWFVDFARYGFYAFGLYELRMPADIAAPGGDLYYHKNHSDAGQVLSTVLKLDGMYAYMSGTSMSCPHVSGVAAFGSFVCQTVG